MTTQGEWYKMLRFLLRREIIENNNSLIVISLSKVGENEFFQNLLPIYKVELSYCHYLEMLKLQKNEKNDLYIFCASWRTKAYLPNCKVSRRPYRTTSRNRLEKLWYMTNIPVLERWRNVVKKSLVSVLYCRCYADLVSASLFQSDNH